MKYSFMTFSTPELTLDENLALAKQYGYDGIEPRLMSRHRHGIEVDTSIAERREIRHKAEESGIALCCLAISCRFADPDTKAQNVEETRQVIELAAAVGAPRIRVFGGKLGKKLSRVDAISLVADALASLADEAKAHGVTICMETHDDWCDPQHVAEVMKQVDHPAIGVNWDIMHPVRTGLATMGEAFAALKPWIRHLHVHDGSKEKGGLVPIGTGDYDHKEVLRLLKTIDYDGFLSGEWIKWKEPYETYLPREVATLRRFEAELA